MCGLVALFEPGRSFAPALLTALGDDIQHRGPDAAGQLAEPGIALSFRRLSVLDPRARSDQPMSDETGLRTLIFNGEIYNYRKLRDELSARGVRFRTSGDTEVVLEGYIAWGEEVFQRLEGMFALVMVDRSRGLALAVRDPLGIKPLYMTRRGEMTAFASEARPLHRLGQAEADPAALAELITFGWAAGRLSNYRGIERIPGGTLVRIDLKSGAVAERRYFDLLDTLQADGKATAEEVYSAVFDSVRDHLASDVGYAVQLSGGVDSSLVAALAASDSGRKLSAYSIGLDNHPYDETPYQEMVVHRYGMVHHRIPVTGKDYADALPRAIRHMEGPTPHGGCVMLMLLCRQIRNETKVVLTGEGADEMFGGYQRYAVWRKTQAQERLARHIPPALLRDRWPFRGASRLRGVDAAVYSSVYHDFRAVGRIFPELIPQPAARETASARFADFRDRLLAVDQSAYLESLLVRQDKMSMAESVEARVPFVHVPLLRLVNRMRHEERVPGGSTKPVLKRLAERYLPGELVNRRKIGLWLPYQEWFADAAGAGRYIELLREPGARLAGYSDRSALRRITDAAVGGSRQGGLILQRLVELELWLRSIADEARPSAHLLA